MRNRRRVLWGERAFLTVELPASACADPPPAVAPELHEFVQSCVRVRPDGDTEHLLIGWVWSTARPDEDDTVHHLRRDGDSGWRWIEADLVCEAADGQMTHVEWDPGEAARVADAWRALNDYFARNVLESSWAADAPDDVARDPMGEMWEALRDARNCAKTVYPHLSSGADPTLSLTYSVKTRAPERRRRFARAIARASRAAARAHVPLRVPRA